ncbi:MAG: hypothetical protein DYH02_08795 [Candidatus Omnitrophica bacterium COP1]|nr:hypothetical protein [Candidatus Omnitrophica bacterium COP1]
MEGLSIRSHPPEAAVEKLNPWLDNDFPFRGYAINRDTIIHLNRYLFSNDWRQMVKNGDGLCPECYFQELL